METGTIKNETKGKQMAKKTLFHSELVELSSRGPVTIKVASEARKSKFQGKPNFIYLVLNGEERAYNFDSQACEAFFNGQNGRTFAVIAAGDREGATLTYVGESAANMQAAPPRPPAAYVAPPTAAPPPATYTPPPATPPAQHTPPVPYVSPPPVAGMSQAQALKETKLFVARRLSLLKCCVRAVASVMPEYKALTKADMSEDVFQKFATTLYISAEAQGLAMRSGFADAMPWKIDLETLSIPVTAPKAAAPPQPQAKPVEPAKRICPVCAKELTPTGVCPDNDCDFNSDAPF